MNTPQRERLAQLVHDALAQDGGWNHSPVIGLGEGPNDIHVVAWPKDGDHDTDSTFIRFRG